MFSLLSMLLLPCLALAGLSASNETCPAESDAMPLLQLESTDALWDTSLHSRSRAGAVLQYGQESLDVSLNKKQDYIVLDHCDATRPELKGQYCKPNTPNPVKVRPCDPKNPLLKDRGWWCKYEEGEAAHTIVISSQSDAWRRKHKSWIYPQRPLHCEYDPVVVLHPDHTIKCVPCTDNLQNPVGKDWCVPNTTTTCGPCDPCDQANPLMGNNGWMCKKNTGTICVDWAGWAVLDPMAGMQATLASQPKSLSCENNPVCKWVVGGVATFVCTAAVAAVTGGAGTPIALDICSTIAFKSIAAADDSNYNDTRTFMEKFMDDPTDFIPAAGKFKLAWKVFKPVAKGLTKAITGQVKVGLKSAAKKTYKKGRKEFANWGKERFRKWMEEPDKDIDSDQTCGPPLRAFPEQFDGQPQNYDYTGRDWNKGPQCLVVNEMSDQMASVWYRKRNGDYWIASEEQQRTHGEDATFCPSENSNLLEFDLIGNRSALEQRHGHGYRSGHKFYIDVLRISQFAVVANNVEEVQAVEALAFVPDGASSMTESLMFLPGGSGLVRLSSKPTTTGIPGLDDGRSWEEQSPCSSWCETQMKRAPHLKNISFFSFPGVIPGVILKKAPFHLINRGVVLGTAPYCNTDIPGDEYCTAGCTVNGQQMPCTLVQKNWKDKKFNKGYMFTELNDQPWHSYYNASISRTTPVLHNIGDGCHFYEKYCCCIDPTLLH